ncbi:serine/threonine-protein kinase [[Phormidium] sp. ETS-05]|uniref:serine/threonine-protein kinase n=1 Tax=[Phormidium] sp. ETS-05 TaxID=222819 RepID=UPI0018EF273B|nr:serine/threonine-protein kinase [[Phormidium] sp. ETS-05]
MSYCLNPDCRQPKNSEGTKFCLSCGAKLTLKDRYRAIAPIGQGGMGRTFLGVDEDRLNAQCAIKQFLPQFQGAALTKAKELFHREAVQLFELGEHPQIPTLYATFEQDHHLYLVQEFIPGQNLLQELYQNGSMRETQIREFLLSMLPVLQFIHDRGAIHRDIKPENILRRPDGKLVLVDFGVAKQGSATALAKPGTTAGTQGYAPMEQLRGGQAYPASDIYSLGVTCIQLLTKTPPDELYDSLRGQWIWREQLAKQGVKVSPQLEQILDKMLQESVKLRYQTAAEVLQDLMAVQSPSPPAKALTPVPSPKEGEGGKSPLARCRSGGGPPVPQSPPLPVTPSPHPPRRDNVALELEELRSSYSEAQPASPGTPPLQPKSTEAKQKTSPDPIQADLEALRTEFGESS